MEEFEVFKAADVGKEAPLHGTLVVDKGNRANRFTGYTHSAILLHTWQYYFILSRSDRRG